MKERNKGITLIALVVTIVVLLILAGVSIAMLTGDNGIITQSQNAKNNTEQAKVEEHVSVAIGSLISKFNGEINGITPKMIADQINEDENRSDVYAENETTFPTYIIFPKEGRKAEANLKTGNDIVDDSIYNASVSESDIAPKDLFDYEIISNGETGSLSLDNLPTRTAKITRIKPEFCNNEGYNPDSNKKDLEDTNYEIIYNGTKISETLIVPYQVDGKYIPGGIEGELYKITEANIYAQSSSGTGIPKTKKIIYPNTIEKLYGGNSYNYVNTILEEVILSQNITFISEGTFCECRNLKSITIPKSVTSIEKRAFQGCESLEEIILPKGITIIASETFEYCKKLNSIIIPDGVTSIESSAFHGCNQLTSITIPKSVTLINTYAINECNNLSTINFAGSQEDWEKIYISYNNNAIKNATINYNYQY